MSSTKSFSIIEEIKTSDGIYSRPYSIFDDEPREDELI